MIVHERPAGELANKGQAPFHVVDTVLATLPDKVLKHSILSGFDASTCMVGEAYEPATMNLKNGILFAATIDDEFLTFVGHYATKYNVIQPAVGVYDERMFRNFASLGYVVNSGLTVVEACTDIFVWR